jgi:rfaE bifunctional protein nucleotidyltransferase chain/domain
MLNKVVSKAEFHNAIRPKLKGQRNQTIVLCHGVFDLVHPGHIIHFEQAKQMGDVLIVSITAAKYVRKGPGRPFFDDEMRLRELASIEFIDYVMLSEGFTVDDIIEAVEPDIYVKGEEYANEAADITGMICKERELVEKHGGRIAYTGGKVYSSTKLINTALSGLTEDVLDYMKRFKEKHSMDDIIRFADKATRMKILVIGDLIIDRYSYCSIQGLMSKDTAYSARLTTTEDYFGGAAAIARHLASFAEDVTLTTIIGDEIDKRQLIESELSSEMKLELFSSHVFPTIVKHRYLSRNQKREEYKKVFVVNNIPENFHFIEDVRTDFKNNLNDSLYKYDAVFVCDFGHGLIDSETIKIIENKAKFIILNCQTNSSNYGLNIITKYHRADAFTIDQKEIKLAFPEYAFDEKKGFKALRNHLGGNGWLTRGSAGSYQIDDNIISECPAFTLSVKDTIGAGDAYYALAGIFYAAGAPIDIGTLVGNIGGALGANIVGNKESVKKVDALKYASTLMNV